MKSKLSMVFFSLGLLTTIGIVLVWNASFFGAKNNVRAWTWFNDPRAIELNGYLLIGAVDDGGYSCLDVVRIVDRKRTATYRLSSRREIDDHNNPAILTIGDGNVLVAYARHNKDDCWFSRKGLFDPENGTITWNTESKHPVEALVTYSNLYRVTHAQSVSGHRIYNFFRGINYNPTYVYSDDDGDTWSQPVQFIAIGNGNVRPYVKYTSNGTLVDMLFTDGHPRNGVTKVYHCYLENNRLFHTDGDLIRGFPTSNDQSISPNDATLVFEDEKRPAWVWDVKRNAAGEVAAAMVVSDDDMAGEGLRYVIARASAIGEWTIRDVATAGRCLYPREAHYAGGIVFDPSNLDIVYFSSNVSAEEGMVQPLDHNSANYSLYQHSMNSAKTSACFIASDQLNRYSFIRPYAIAGSDSNGILLFLKGDYLSYMKFNTEVEWFTIDSIRWIH